MPRTGNREGGIALLVICARRTFLKRANAEFEIRGAGMCERRANAVKYGTRLGKFARPSRSTAESRTDQPRGAKTPD